MQKTRLDLLLVEHGLVESRAKAQAMVMAGQVRVDGQVELKPSAQVSPESQLDLESGPRFVSRGGDKLEAALQSFPLQVSGRICADVGSSTGGFTDCLLQHGAVKVYAIDVGKGILHWKLRTDPRVVVMEDTNARYVEILPEAVRLVTIDASFISLKILLPVVKGWFLSSSSEHLPSREKGEIIALIKPQFEAGRRESARNKGIIRDPAVHRSVLVDILEYARGQGLTFHGLIRSPVLGPKGNVEFLAWCESGGDGRDGGMEIEEMLTQLSLG
jgi:23S rRNA (cytidine1920-2'-O)/16S rRNA (cytidine1409-2'-O)-methyltransferase